MHLQRTEEFGDAATPPFEPFRAKVVEPIPRPGRLEREAALEAAGWNLFRLPASAVAIDLLTDSGVSAMSAAQWAALHAGEEAYAGSGSFERFAGAVREVTGFPEVLPTHQGRGAEKVLFETIVRPGCVVPGNTHFDTTRAQIERNGGRAVDCPSREASDGRSGAPFKGDVDLDALAAILSERPRAEIPLVLVTITNNRLGGHPVSLGNLRAVRRECDRAGVPLFLDAARHAENAWLARERDPALRGLSVADVARAYFDLADGCLMSAKKDGLANTGGFLAMRDPRLADAARRFLILDEGFPTYGGLAARDLEAIAVGLREAVAEEYLAWRIGQVRRFGEAIEARGVPIVRPPGGHAVFVDAGSLLPHIPPAAFPGQALGCALYLEAGVRGVEVGSLMFGRGAASSSELLRLAVPRRVYSDAHLAFVADALGRIAGRRERIRGLRLVEEAPFLRHFTARLAPLGSPAPPPEPAPSRPLLAVAPTR